MLSCPLRVSFGADEHEWLPRRDLEDCEALDV